MKPIAKSSRGSKLRAGPKVKAGGEVPRRPVTDGRKQAARREPSFGQEDRRRPLK